MLIIWTIILIILLYLLVTYIMFFLGFKRIEGKVLKKAHKKIYKNALKYKNELDELSNWLKDKSNVTEDIYTMSNDNLKLHGLFIKNKEIKKIFIVVHGYRSCSDKNLFASFPKYYDKGYNILLIDQRATGKSEGKYITMGIKESDDIICWLKYLNEEYKNCEIILSGISMGASTILMASNKIERNMNVKHIIADCGFISPYQEIKYFFKHFCHINGSISLFMINNWCRLFGKFNLKEDNTLSAISKCRIPILFIHGSNDEIVPPINTKMNYEHYKGKKELLIVNNAKHALSYFVDSKKYLEEIYKIL